MKAITKAQLANATATVVSFIASDAHFLTKSLADGIASTEASIINKLTGEAKSAVIEDRHNTTEQTQEQFNSMYNGVMDNIKSFAKATHTSSMELVHEIQTFNVVHNEE